MPMCPSCQKAKLIRCKILRTGDADYGREYVACSACSSKWFLDDPNRPAGLVSDKPRQSIWKKLGTWGAPHNVPDSNGVLHPATYVLPPVHEYPSLLVPISKPVRRSNLVPPAGPTPASSADPPPVSPESGPSELDLPPPPPPPEPQLDPIPSAEHVDIPEQKLEEPAQAADQPEPTPPPQKADEPHPAEEPTTAPEEPGEKTSPSPEQNTPESHRNQAAFISEAPQQPEEQKSTPASNYDSEEQARFEMLNRIAYSPAPPSQASTYHPKEGAHEPTHPPSIRESEKQSSSPPKTSSESISPEEQHLRETLLRVVSTPCPPTPKVYTTLLSPKMPREEATWASSPADEHELAAYNQRISARLDEAIQNSPFISKEHLKTPRSERWHESPRVSEPKSPVSKRSTHSSRHSSSHPQSPRQSVHRTPRSTKSPEPVRRSTPFAADEVSLPSGFPTPKSRLSISDSVSKLQNQRPSPYSTSLKSPAPSGPLPMPPSHHASSVAGGRTPKHVYISSPDKSPLFG